MYVSCAGLWGLPPSPPPMSSNGLWSSRTRNAMGRQFYKFTVGVEVWQLFLHHLLKLCQASWRIGYGVLWTEQCDWNKNMISTQDSRLNALGLWQNDFVYMMYFVHLGWPCLDLGHRLYHHPLSPVFSYCWVGNWIDYYINFQFTCTSLHQHIYQHIIWLIWLPIWPCLSCSVFMFYVLKKIKI